MSKQILKYNILALCFILPTFTYAQSSNASRELSRLNNSLNKQNMRIDSLDAQMRLLLPELQNALSANLKAKEQTDSVAILLINRINTLQNKIRMLEDKSIYKIVTLANSFTEMYDLKNNNSSAKVSSKISPVEYKKTYIDALSAYQNGDYNKAINGFSGLVLTDPSNDLADNSQYWLAECYYTIKNYKRAVIEFEKVFSFSGTDKDDDAQLKLGHCHRSMGNIKKAKEEYQRLLDYFPGSEFYDKARNSLKQLSSQ